MSSSGSGFGSGSTRLPSSPYCASNSAIDISALSSTGASDWIGSSGMWHVLHRHEGRVLFRVTIGVMALWRTKEFIALNIVDHAALVAAVTTSPAAEWNICTKL